MFTDAIEKIAAENAKKIACARWRGLNEMKILTVIASGPKCGAGNPGDAGGER